MRSLERVLMASLTVLEWLTYIPIFVDFSNAASFAAWLKTELHDEAIERTLEDILSAKGQAWISPDFSTTIASLEGKVGKNVDLDIHLEFRLRTLCLEIRCWKSGITGMHVGQAFAEMKEAEEEFTNFTEKWGTNSPTVNVLALDPFYDTTNNPRDWIEANIQELNFFPNECRSGYGFTTSLSKLLERDEKTPALVTSIRDNKGIQRKLILLCAPGKPRGDYPRWVFFSSLVMHVLERANSAVQPLSEEMSQLEERVLLIAHEAPDEKSSLSMDLLGFLTASSKRLYSLEHDLAVASDDVEGAKKNIPLLGRTADSAGVSEERVEDEKIAGNVTRISSPESKISFGIYMGENQEESFDTCNSGYYCILCDERRAPPTLTQAPPLKMGVVDETMALVRSLIVEFENDKSEVISSMERVKALIFGLLDVSSTQADLQLSLSYSQTAIDQKTILSKMQSVLEESAKDRKATENATKSVEILSLLFASFVIGEIASNFMIGGIEQFWPNGAPWFAFAGGFILAIAFACGTFSLAYLVYLRKKWRDHPK
jgi:hypothetical protein